MGVGTKTRFKTCVHRYKELVLLFWPIKTYPGWTSLKWDSNSGVVAKTLSHPLHRRVAGLEWTVFLCRVKWSFRPNTFPQRSHGCGFLGGDFELLLFEGGLLAFDGVLLIFEAALLVVTDEVFIRAESGTGSWELRSIVISRSKINNVKVFILSNLRLVHLTKSIWPNFG